MADKRKAAVIVAAGYSSRMKAFKPLLKMANSTIIETAINTFRSIGVIDIVVVTGHNAEALETHIESTRAICLRSDYTRNKMFDSACIGLKYLKDKCDMVFFTPVDSPLFTKHSLNEMVLKMEANNYSVLCPCYLNEEGHPLLINSNCFETILSYDGTLGMKGAVRGLKDVKMINLPDPALVMDADTPLDYEIMKQYEQERAVPTGKICMMMYQHFKTPEKMQKHCKKVAVMAVGMAEELIRRGYPLDVNKIQSAALIHDILRYKKNHASEAARLLEDLGCTGISPIVKAHIELDEDDVFNITEKSVLYLADKLVCEDSIISLEERYNKKMKLYENDESAYKAVEKRYNQVKQVEKMIYRAIEGEILYG